VVAKLSEVGSGSGVYAWQAATNAQLAIVAEITRAPAKVAPVVNDVSPVARAVALYISRTRLSRQPGGSPKSGRSRNLAYEAP
jgi:hypothetical protein